MTGGPGRQVRGNAVLEFMCFIGIFVAALIVFSPHIRAGMQGQFRKAGESFGLGREYSAGATLDCARDDKGGLWYSQACFSVQVMKDQCKSRFDECGAPVEPAYQKCDNLTQTEKDILEYDGGKAENICAEKNQKLKEAFIAMKLECENRNTYSKCIDHAKRICSYGC